MNALPEIMFDTHGSIGLVTLNRPEALNALTLNMVRLLDEQLVQWAGQDDVRVVVVIGAGGRAFCSGGDVKAVALEVRAAQEGKGESHLAQDFFRAEYTLNNRIHSYAKPYISLIDGIVMGGGKGISAHGSHRVVTEHTLFAMPETNIGFFPDVGGGYFLPRCPGETGTYLALTSRRIRAIDTIYIGFATHYVPSANIPALLDALATTGWDNRTETRGQVSAMIDQFATEPAGASELAPHRETIDACFGHDRVEDIVAALEDEGSSFALETLNALYGMSPTSLKIALRQIRAGVGMNFSEVMTMEYRLSQACIARPDFYEGIRAALIDKDRQPKWNPARIDAVDDAQIARCFDSLGKNDLIL